MDELYAGADSCAVLFEGALPRIPRNDHHPAPQPAPLLLPNDRLDVLEGEDVVQEALFHAYRKLDTFFEDDRPRWCHGCFASLDNCCVDFLRFGVKFAGRPRPKPPNRIPSRLPKPAGPMLGHAVEYLVLALPPKERSASVLLERCARLLARRDQRRWSTRPSAA